MSSVINTNIPSLQTQNSLTMSQASVATSIQRLSSGLRINSAADDAAGLAIADRMNSQIQGQTVAQRNANDGISLAQTAEGALSSVTDDLQRMRELAVQASNGSNTVQDRATMNQEYKQVSADVFNVLNSTTYNGQNLFTGVGTGASAGIASGDNPASASLSLVFQVGANVVNGKLNDQISISLSDLSNDPTLAAVLGTTAGLIGGAQTTGAATAITTAQSVLTSAQSALDTLFTSSSTMSASDLATSAKTLQANIDSAQLSLDSAIADPNAQTDAQKQIQDLDQALATIASANSQFGAVQNRFTAVIANSQTSSENLTSARSQIMDTNFASETANLSRAQILTQAGEAMLAQANSAPNGVLSLLR
jgi:flagellin